MLEPTHIILGTVNFNSNIANLLPITGDNLKSIAFVNIGGTGFKPVLGSGSLFVTIPRDTFATGDYFVLLQLTDGKIVSLNEKISFTHSDSRINIANITPGVIRNDQERFVVIQ